MSTAFEVTILGCSSASPTPDRHPSSQVVNINSQYILIDCGEGTQNQIFKYHIKFSRITKILISHLHGDHFLGLPGLLSTLSLNGRTEPLEIIGPPGLQPFLEYFYKVSETYIKFPIAYIETNMYGIQQVCKNEKYDIYSFPLKHRITCTGFMIKTKSGLRKINKIVCDKYEVPVVAYPSLKAGEDFATESGYIVPNTILTFDPQEGKSYAYVSDSIYDEEIIPYVQEVDLLYHESTFLHEMLERANETFHTTALQAGDIAKKAAVGKLLIGHFSARYKTLEPLVEEARTEFANTDLALEGLTFVV